ncbi:hypothetical protein DEU56DRAFT_984772 [Suillus clintonianus]|uniref:uncharacterized protein n=1 Tax=Suillus clintonianus TaxID=1904413 RepID=UPI001B86CBED|nr:uncharacterized protein DEU56DRAFT_984772 [Suillus clintonianus]KAG2118300.1 hypothetical protein DEU56DRAFT_984772 [Suillus clintonianus]
MSLTEGEQPWTLHAGLYTRPLYGSELSHNILSELLDGGNEYCMGVSFTCTIPLHVLVPSIRNALCFLRFYSPLLAASIEKHDPNPAIPMARSWSYKPVCTLEDAKTWAEASLTVHRASISDDDFVLSMNQIRLPYTDRGELIDKQHFGCHLVLRASGVHSIFFHTAHCLADGFTSYNALYRIFDLISTDAHTSIDTLDWGQEWRNLPVGPITATGGPKDGWESEVEALDAAARQAMEYQQYSKGLVAQRDHVLVRGKSVRIHRVLDSKIFKEILNALALTDFTVTQLLEAAQVLAVLQAHQSELLREDKANVILDFTIISYLRFLVPPYNGRSHHVSFMCTVPMVVYATDVPWNESSKAQLLAVMARLREQYAIRLSNKHLPHIGSSQNFQENPNALMITNLQKVEDRLPLNWPLGSHNPTVQISDMRIGLRLTDLDRPMTHIWSLRSELHIHLAACDLYDKSYLDNFVDNMIAIALSIIDRDA